MSSPDTARMAAEGGGVWKCDDIPASRFAPGLDLRLFGGEQVTVSVARMEAGVVVPSHAHPHEQITYVIDGMLEAEVGEGSEKLRIGPGEIAYVPGGVAHETRALADTNFIEVFAPRRDDLHAKATELAAADG